MSADALNRQASTEWVDLGKGLGSSFPITDIVIVNKKEKAAEYHVVRSPTNSVYLCVHSSL